MLSALMDEVGLSTNYNTNDGFLHFIGIGGVVRSDAVKPTSKIQGKWSSAPVFKIQKSTP
jgi:putative aminopeptidase FrvX